MSEAEDRERENQAAELARWRGEATPDMLKNYETAKTYFEAAKPDGKHHVEPEKVASYIMGIDLTKPVQEDTLKPGMVLQRFDHPKAKQKLHTSYYTAPLNLGQDISQ